VILYGCNTAELAQYLSVVFPNIYFTGATDLVYSDENEYKGTFLFYLKDLEKGIRAKWETYFKGELISTSKQTYPSPVQNNKDNQQNLKEDVDG